MLRLGTLEELADSILIEHLAICTAVHVHNQGIPKPGSQLEGGLKWIRNNASYIPVTATVDKLGPHQHTKMEYGVPEPVTMTHTQVLLRVQQEPNGDVDRVLFTFPNHEPEYHKDKYGFPMHPGDLGASTDHFVGVVFNLLRQRETLETFHIPNDAWVHIHPLSLSIQPVETSTTYPMCMMVSLPIRVIESLNLPFTHLWMTWSMPKN